MNGSSSSFLLLSDLHLEFAPFDLPQSHTDKDTVLVLAGDIGVVAKPNDFKQVKEWIPRFKHTIMIQGNHEMYHGSLIRSKFKQREIFHEEIALGKASVADCEVVRVDNVSYICTTLWTDFDRNNPIAMNAVRACLNDYRFIRTGNHLSEPYQRRIKPYDTYNDHQIDRKFIFDHIVSEKAAGQKVVVVTHHGCSTMSIHPNYQGDMVNWGYVSELDQQILDTNPDYFVHGHVHSSFDYMIGNTRVLTNPRGYCRVYDGIMYPENANFNPSFRVEV
jgi:hypothetical protein